MDKSRWGELTLLESESEEEEEIEQDEEEDGKYADDMRYVIGIQHSYQFLLFNSILL